MCQGSSKPCELGELPLRGSWALSLERQLMEGVCGQRTPQMGLLRISHSKARRIQLQSKQSTYEASVKILV